jgi:hypothetical protein
MRKRKLSAGPIVRTSTHSPANFQRWPCRWNVWWSLPSASTFHWTTFPIFAFGVGVLRGNARPLIVMKPRCVEKKTTFSRSARRSSRPRIDIEP